MRAPVAALAESARRPPGAADVLVDGAAGGVARGAAASPAGQPSGAHSRYLRRVWPPAGSRYAAPLPAGQPAASAQPVLRNILRPATAHLQRDLSSRTGTHAGARLDALRPSLGRCGDGNGRVVRFDLLD